MHKDEVKAFMSFDSEHFTKTGLFIDLDYFKTENITISDSPKLIRESMKIIWERIDAITLKLGI